MTQLTIVANITAHPDHIDSVQSELIKLIPPTRKEAGCLRYELHQDNENPARFVFLERWESEALLNQHLQSEHIKQYLATTEGALASFTIEKLTCID